MAKSWCGIRPRSFLGLFFLFSLYFLFGTGWYEPAELRLAGRLLGESATLNVQWDSGHGFNAYETETFPLAVAVSSGRSRHEVLIRRLGDQNSASLTKDVWVSNLAIDGHSLNLADLAKQQGIPFDREGLRLTEEQPQLRLDVAADQSIVLELPRNNHSGLVAVAINGNIVQHDLYAPNADGTWLTLPFWLIDPNGEFTVRATLPRYQIEQLRVVAGDGNVELSAIDFVGAGKRLPLWPGPADRVVGQAPVEPSTVLLSGKVISQSQKAYGNLWQNLLQLLFAALTTWLTAASIRLYRQLGGFTGIWQDGRVFITLFVLALLVFGSWLAIFWPGIASIDSLKIWRAAVLPDVYLNDHPLLNVLLYKYLAHFSANMAIVPVFQIVALGLLAAWIFSAIHRRGVSLALLAPCYIFFLLSIPVGLYNTVLWKDIPFALLVVFWAYTLVDLWGRKVEHGEWPSTEKLCALFLLLLAVGLIRHNGMLYFVVIPFLLLILGFFRLRHVLLMTALVTIGVAGLMLLLMQWGDVSGFNFLLHQISGFLTALKDSSVTGLLLQMIENYAGIFNINQTGAKWDLWHFFLGDRYAYSFIQQAGWDDVYTFLPQEYGPLQERLRHLAMSIYWRSYDPPWVFLSWNQLHTLVLLPLAVLLFFRLPRAAIFSLVILSQIAALLLLDILNWRYYYFACLAGYFLVPIILLDIRQRKWQKLAAEGIGTC